ncbi:vWA domain-containing protein [Bacillus niameyensis]|uniref:vWA domain-containing protein n=1 Tax=Bacillus niameyensis TaxID=1522308 RepID=UPI0009FE7913|nr:VWA domain-containing protein [Bacillus niameyensis]
MMRTWITLLFVLLLLGGCSGKDEKVENEEANTANVEEVTKEVEEPLEEPEKEPQSSSEHKDLNTINQIKIPASQEELLEQDGGLFTKDIAYEEETKQIWGNFGLGDYEEQLTEELQKVANSTQDPTAIFQALHYYIGSYAYGRASEELENYTVEWFEPYLPEPDEMEESEGTATDPGKALILLDASSSMLLSIEGKQKMDVAKSAAGRFANTIGSTHDVSLIVYGHAGTQNDQDKQLSCTTIDEIYPLQPFNADTFTAAVDNVEAKGWTPIANAIKAAREKMAGTNENVTLYIISDGAETCDGDPVAEAKAFASEDSGRSVNIIGFDVDAKGENALKEVAAAGNGEYISAKTIEDLNNSIRKTWVPSFQEIMSKSNSLIKHWGQDFQSMVDRTDLSEKIYYTSLNEKSRFYSALNIMRAQKMITPEVYDEIKQLIEAKAKLALTVYKDLDKQKMDEIEADRQQVIERVNEWSDRMNELRKAQGN